VFALPMPTILVTGATGFIGQPLCAALLQRGYNLKAWVRSSEKARVLDEKVAIFITDFESSDTKGWHDALRGVDILIHLAGRVHDPDQTAINSFRRVNTDGTTRLCRLAVECGVRQFIYISTIKVNGETSTRPFSENDPVDAQGSYALSKLEAEEWIKTITRNSRCRYIIIRPPLVYGPQVKANFLNLLKITAMNFPLPMKSFNNQRSMIYVGNLVDAIICAMESPRSADQVFMVSDGKDRSVAHVVAAIAKAMGNHPRLFPFPKVLLRLFFRMIGRGEVIDKLSQPLKADISKMKMVLSWQPPFSFEQGITDTVNWFQKYNDR
jgi:nucleoside-diphosphate-sugar epimerase